MAGRCIACPCCIHSADTLSQFFAAAKYAGLELDYVSVFGADGSKNKDYEAKFPFGKIPTFEGADGFVLSETKAIARYSE